MSVPTSERPLVTSPPLHRRATPGRAGEEIDRRAFTFMVLALAVGVGVLSLICQRTSSEFYADDYLYLQLARAGSLTPQWLSIENYGHFAPITRLAYFVVQRNVGLDYGAAALLPAALAAVIMLALAALFRELLGRRYLALGLAVLGATSVPLLRTLLWWGAAVHVLGAAAAMTACVAAFVIYSRRGHEVYRIVSVAALVLGLLVQERPMITIGYLVLIRYLLRVGLPVRRTRRQVVVEDARFWLPWVLVEVAYFVYRVFFFDSSPQPGSPGQGAEFVALSVVRGWAPSLVGSRVLPFHPILTPGVVVGLLAVLVASAVLVLRRVGAWRALAFLVAIYLANMGIVALGRLSVVDLQSYTTDLQYYVDVHLGTLIAFVLGFTVLPKRPGRPPWAALSAPLTRGVLVVAALALVVSTAATWHAILRGNNETVAHAYLPRALSQLESRPAPFALLRTKLPVDVVPTFIDPYSDAPGVFTLDPEVVDRLDPTAADRVVVLPDGTVASTHPDTTVNVDPVAHPDRVSGGEQVRQTSAGTCLSGGTESYFRVRLPGRIAGRGLFFAVTYTTAKSATGVGTMLDGSPAYNWTPTSLPAGKNVTVVDRLDGTAARFVQLTFPDGLADFCVSHFWVGRLATEVGGQCMTLDGHAAPLNRSHSCGRDWKSLSAGSGPG